MKEVIWKVAQAIEAEKRASEKKGMHEHNHQTVRTGGYYCELRGSWEQDERIQNNVKKRTNLRRKNHY